MSASADSAYFNQDGGRWAARQIEHHRFTGYEQALLYLLGSRADRDGTAFPSQEYLADRIGVTLRSIERMMMKLRMLEVVATTRQSKRHGRPNSYQLLNWVELSPPQEVLQSEVANKTRHQSRVRRGLPDSGVAPYPTQESALTRLRCRLEDSIEDSRKRESAEGDIFAQDDPPSPAASAHSPVACGDPAAKPPRTKIERWLETWNLGCHPNGKGLIAIKRALHKNEVIALQNAHKHPALAHDPDAWRRYCRWCRDDAFLGGKIEGGFGASLLQVLKATTIDRWAAQDQGPPAAAPATPPPRRQQDLDIAPPAAPKIPVIPPYQQDPYVPPAHFVQAEVDAFRAAQREACVNDPEYMAHIRALRESNCFGDKSGGKTARPVSGAPGGPGVDVEHDPPPRRRSMVDA